VLGAYSCYLFGARERKDEIVGKIAEPRTQKEAHLLRYLIPLHHDLKTARGLLLGRTSENSVWAKF
jgi:hypothetical protein